MSWKDKTAFIAIVGLGLFLMPASQQPLGGGGGGGSGTTSRAPSFSSFSVTPNPLCLNFGVPVVNVSYTIDPAGWSNPNTLCVGVEANGEYVHNTPNHKCLSDGASQILSFNALDFFNNAPPSTITITATLRPSIAGDPYDTRSASITAMNCEPPSLNPG